jgi:hypothetical protein
MSCSHETNRAELDDYKPRSNWWDQKAVYSFFFYPTVFGAGFGRNRFEEIALSNTYCGRAYWIFLAPNKRGCIVSMTLVSRTSRLPFLIISYHQSRSL